MISIKTTAIQYPYSLTCLCYLSIHKFLFFSQFSQSVFEDILSIGEGFGLHMGGAYAVDSLRMEKGYRHWGHELDTETTPWEARLGFTVDMNKVSN